MTQHAHSDHSRHKGPSCDHDHGPGGHDHSHADVSSTDGRRRVAIAGVLTAGFMMAEVAGGLISGSLALLADAAHMLTDAASLGLAWLGYKLAARPADGTRTYGFSRLRILAAFTNGLALLALAVWITFEGIQRLFDPQPVMGPLLLGVAIGGLIVNLVCFGVLHGGDQEDLNMRGALWHVAGDLLGSVAAILAAVIIIYTGWMPIDPILSILVALLVAVAGWRITKQAGHILAQGAPQGLDAVQIKTDLLANISGLASIDHIHIWALTEKETIASLQANLAADAAPEETRAAIKTHLRDVFDIDDITVELCR